MTKFYALQKDVFDINKVTVVGSPTITSDGILSNCSNGNAVNTKVQLSQLKGKSWTIKGSVVLGSTSHALVKLSSVGNYIYINFGNVLWSYNTKRICFNAKTGIAGDTDNQGIHITSLSTFETGDKVYYTLTFDITTGTYSLYADKVNGTTYQGQWTPSTDNKELYYINTQPSYYISLGSGSDSESYLTTGSIDLAGFKIYINNELVYSPTKPTYYLERRKEGFDLSKFTVVGSPTITEDGVLTSESKANYVTTIKANTLYNKSWEIISKFTVNSENTGAWHTSPIYTFGAGTQYLAFCGVAFETAQTRLQFTGKTISGTSGEGTHGMYKNFSDFVYGTTFLTKFTFDYPTKTYAGYYMREGIDTDWVLCGSKWVCTDENPNLLGTNNDTDVISIGIARDTHTLIGTSVYLSQFSITVDGKEVFTGAKEQYYAMKGGM